MIKLTSKETSAEWVILIKADSDYREGDVVPGRPVKEFVHVHLRRQGNSSGSTVL